MKRMVQLIRQNSETKYWGEFVNFVTISSKYSLTIEKFPYYLAAIVSHFSSSLDIDKTLVTMGNNNEDIFKYTCGFPNCDRMFKSQHGRTKHHKVHHQFQQTNKKDSENETTQAYHYFYHKKLNGLYFIIFRVQYLIHTTILALPTNKSGNLVSKYTEPEPWTSIDAMPENPWYPFEG